MQASRGIQKSFYRVVRFPSFCCCVAAALLTWIALPASAATYYWIAGTGDWSSVANWCGAVPGSSDIGCVYNDGTALVNTSCGCGTISLGETDGGASGTIRISEGGVLAGSVTYVGYNGAGSIVQTAGTCRQWMLGSLYLGYNAGASGTYQFDGGAVGWADSESPRTTEYIGYSGVGLFTQSGGTNTLSGRPLYVGYNSGSTGTYELNGGLLEAHVTLEVIGNSGVGIFTQTGGTNTTRDYCAQGFYLGANTGSTGTYNLQGGLLYMANSENIGCSGTGRFSQTGGTNTVLQIYLASGSDSTGIYELSNSSLLTATLSVGDSGTGVFTQTSGTLVVSPDAKLGGNIFSGVLCLGNYSGARGTYNLNGGSASVVTEYIGYSGFGIFAQTGGTNTVLSELSVGRSSQGTYTLSGSGVLCTPILHLGEFSGTGTFVQSGGTNSIAGSLLLAQNSTATMGTYRLIGNGVLSARDEYISAPGKGTFLQVDGVNSAVTLSLGTAGIYYLGGGTLNIVGGLASTGTMDLLSGPATINASSAILDFSHGTLTNRSKASLYADAHSLVIVPSSSSASFPGSFAHYSNGGILYAAGTTLSIGASQSICGVGSITGPLNCYGTLTATSGYRVDLWRSINLVDGGVVNLGAGSLTVQDAVSTMSGGSLSVSNEYVGWSLGAGTFTQTGGTHSVSGALYIGDYGSSGLYSLSGNAILSANCESIASYTSGTFTQTGGTHTVNSLAIAATPNSDGVYNFTGGLLTVGSMVGSYGIAMLNFGGGTLSATGTVGCCPITLTGIGGDATIDTNGHFVQLYTISGAGNLNKVGAGTLTMGYGTNTYTGATRIYEGLVAGYFSASTGTYYSSFGTGTIVMAGGSLTTVSGNTNTRIGNPIVAAAATNSGIGVFDSANTVSVRLYPTTTTGAGTLTLIHASANTASCFWLGGSETAFQDFQGTVILEQAGGGFLSPTKLTSNSATWVVNCSLTCQATNGTFSFGALSGGTAGRISAQGSTLICAIGQANTDSTYAGGIYDYGSSTSGSHTTLLVKYGSGMLTLTGASLYGGTNSSNYGTIIRTGTLCLGNGGTAGSIIHGVANSGALAFNRSDNYTFAYVITGSGQLHQLGSGRTTLGTSSSYTGATCVKNGTLALSATGAIASSVLIDVAEGATFDVSARTSGWTLGAAQTLSGNGTVKGGVTANGTVSAGDSIGTLLQEGNWTLNGTLAAEIGTATTGRAVSDLVAVTGSVSLSNANLALSVSTPLALAGRGADAVGAPVAESPATFTPADVTFWYCLTTNDGNDAVTGEFAQLNGAAAGLAEGSLFDWNGLRWMITYQANYDGATPSFTGGNDIAIGTVPEPPALVLLGVGAAGLLAYGRRRFGIGSFAKRLLRGEVAMFFLALLACLLSAGPAASARAAVTTTGDISPAPITSWNTNTYGYIGNTASGTVTVDGGALFSGTASVGHNSDVSGVVNISGTGATWTNSGSVAIGDCGYGTLSITGGGTVNSLFFSRIGSLVGSNGFATVSGSGSTWNNAGNFTVGRYGNGTLSITDGGLVSVGNTVFVAYAGTNTGVIDFGSGGGTLSTLILYSRATDLKGTGTILTGGLVSDVNLTFDGCGTTSVSFGTGGTMSVALTSYTNIGDLGVGYVGAATATIQNGGTVVSFYGYLGYGTGSTGVALVHGSNTVWQSLGDLYVGNRGSGTLSITDHGTVINSSNVGRIGTEVGSTGQAIVSGSGSQWANGAVVVGDSGNGTLSVVDGAYVNSGTGLIAGNTSTIGLAVISGAGSQWKISGECAIGNYGSGSLSITEGASASCSQGSIAAAAGSRGWVSVSGSGSQWACNGLCSVGHLGRGTLSIANGGTASCGSSRIAYGVNSTGLALVSETSSQWNISGYLYVGNSGGGTLSVANGATVSCTDGYIGNGSNSTGLAIISGSGSVWKSGGLYVGNSGSGTLSMAGGSRAWASSVSVNSNSWLTTDIGRGSLISIGTGVGTITNNGSIRMSAGAAVAAGTYKPISARGWIGSGTCLAVGGTWGTSSHTFTVSTAATTTAGASTTIDRAAIQRLLVDDGSGQWAFGASVLGTTTASTMSMVASVLGGDTLTALATISGDSVLNAWTVSADNYAVSDAMPVYLSLRVGGGWSLDDLRIWQYSGGSWSECAANDLAYDGTYASFTATALGGYGVTAVPEPGTLALLAAGLIGSLVWAWQRRRGAPGRRM
jgi:T5SS/PEP-CTERM-associated repeat protein/autotransporter-associated beta strand protein